MMTSRFALMIALTLAGAATAAERSIMVYQDQVTAATARISECGSGCVRQMSVTTTYSFVHHGDYQGLLSELSELSLRTTVYDTPWEDSEVGELLFKVSSTIHQRQRWRRANMRRKVENPTELANAIYTTVPAGTVVTLELTQTPVPLISEDFTVNIRRYNGDQLMGTGSYAFSPRQFSDDYHMQ